MAIEKELKYHLEKPDYERLLRACRDVILRRDNLVNYYFDDTKLSLRKKRFGLRIRVSGREASVTLKFPAKSRRSSIVGFKARHEYEDKIPLARARAVIRGAKALTELNVSAAKILNKSLPLAKLAGIGLLGAMKTQRTLAKVAGFKMEIDRCDFFHKRFYELEVETSRPSAADKVVRKLFGELDIAYKPISKSKLGRFLDEWQKKKPKKRTQKKR